MPWPDSSSLVRLTRGRVTDSVGGRCGYRASQWQDSDKDVLSQLAAAMMVFNPRFENLPGTAGPDLATIKTKGQAMYRVFCACEYIVLIP